MRSSSHLQLVHRILGVSAGEGLAGLHLLLHVEAAEVFRAVVPRMRSRQALAHLAAAVQLVQRNLSPIEQSRLQTFCG